jgi:hypothetical protein
MLSMIFLIILVWVKFGWIWGIALLICGLIDFKYIVNIINLRPTIYHKKSVKGCSGSQAPQSPPPPENLRPRRV